MSRKIFVNLPVKDLNKAIAFFTQLGFTFNAQFTDETGACMIVSDDIFISSKYYMKEGDDYEFTSTNCFPRPMAYRT